MAEYLLDKEHNVGAHPGRLADPTTANKIGGLTIYRVDLGGDAAAIQQQYSELSAALAAADKQASRQLCWLHFEGDVSAQLLRQLAEIYPLHSLALEDVLNRGQRPKLDVYKNHLFAITILPQNHSRQLTFQQVSIFIGDGFVLSFHAGDVDLFAPLRERIRDNLGHIAQAGSDYLAYCLLDIVIDTSFLVLSDFNERIDVLEDDVFSTKGQDLIEAIHGIRRQLIGIRQMLFNQNELLLRLIGLDHALVHQENRVYFRDAQDHSKRMLDLAESHYDATGTLLATHLSLSSARLNDVMRVLTIIATIFMPLSFIAAVYGMNFDTRFPLNMPELAFRYGYIAVLGLMLVVALGMLLYFRRKHWL